MNDELENIVSVKILDRSYKIKCHPEQTRELQEAAHYLEDQMRKVMQSSVANSTDRVTIVTALNVCHELMQTKKQKNNYIEIVRQRIQNLQHRIKNFLAASEEITV